MAVIMVTLHAHYSNFYERLVTDHSLLYFWSAVVSKYAHLYLADVSDLEDKEIQFSGSHDDAYILNKLGWIDLL